MAVSPIGLAPISRVCGRGGLYLRPSCQLTRRFSVQSAEPAAQVVLTNGLPRFHIPLPSRKETCVFTMRPLSNTVGDLIEAIREEDKGIDRIALLSPDGLRIAKANSIELLLSSNFTIEINDQKYPVDISSLNLPKDVSASEINHIRTLIGQLNCALNADDVYAERERELRRCIDDITMQLEPFEQKRSQLAAMAAERTRRLTWIGLGAMGLQFGLLARLTWWEYSWDIMEPVTYFVGYGTTMAMYAYYVVTRQDYSFPQVFDREYLKVFYKKATEKGFDVERYNQLCDKLAALRSDLRRLRDPLYLRLPLQQTGFLVKEDVKENLETGCSSSSTLPLTPPPSNKRVT
ncbi:hypothetical protein SprV_0501856100 [Sparganum proliferum]